VKSTWLAGALFSALIAAAPATAQDAPAAPAPPADSNPVLTFFKGTELSGFVDTYYSYNFNTPSKPCATAGGVSIFNCLHNFDVAHNSFSLNLAELALEKKPTADSRAGFRIDLDYGSAAAIVAGAEPGGTPVYQNIQQAYVSFLAPTSKGSVQVDVGKFVTAAGDEVIETKDNWNYSRGLLFALAIPYYHTGVRAAYSPNDKVTVSGYVFNGWNNAADNNGGKSIGVSLTTKPSAAVSLTENYIGGPEIAGDNKDWRQLSDTVVTYTASPQVSLALNYDFGKELASQWQGVAAYLRYQPTAWFALSPRYEFFKDRDGFATGTKQNVQDLTVTLEFKHKDGALMRVEYRGDMSDTPFFIQNTSGTVKNQNVLTVGWVYAFSTKTP
jgi:Putative beta-barrel porin-2, OmpL-like. bbp2